ncbi:hypothetical protein MRX96_044221 [Rhipicephalus microplus]
MVAMAASARASRYEPHRIFCACSAFCCCLMGLVVSACLEDRSVLADMLGPKNVEFFEPAVPSTADSWGWWCRRASRIGACWLICLARTPYSFLASST